MPTGHKNPPKQYGPPGSRVQVFDLIQAIGGEMEEIGQSIQSNAVLFPATRGWIIEDLEHAEALCRKWIAVLKTPTKEEADDDAM